MGWKLLKFILSLLILTVDGKVVPVLDETWENCVSDKDRAGAYDTSRLEVINVDDFHSVLNGTWKFTRDIEAPWNFKVFTERFERGQWNVFAFNRRVNDLCSVLHNPTEPWYNIFKHVQGCPIKSGVRKYHLNLLNNNPGFSRAFLQLEWVFNMVPLELNAIIIPRSFEGKWRMTQISEFKVDGVIKKECFRTNFEFVDMGRYV